jgi:thiosulfate reductase cytochrome b subunit
MLFFIYQSKRRQTMKKLIFTGIMAAVLLVSSGTAFAANNISGLAVNNGGQAVAQCARTMPQGVSNCINMSACLGR